MTYATQDVNTANIAGVIAAKLISNAMHHARSRFDESNNALKCAVRITEISATIRDRETAIKAAIANEKDENSKDKYSNAEKRAAEFAVRADFDEELVAARAELEKQTTERAKCDNRARFHADMKDIYCAYAPGKGESNA